TETAPAATRFLRTPSWCSRWKRCRSSNVILMVAKQPDDLAPSARAVGNNVARKDGIGKATGRAQYADDLVFPGMLHGRTIRATIPRGRVKSVRLDFDQSGFTVVDYRDIPGRNLVALIAEDQPCLVETMVRHAAEPVLLLAHEDRDRVLEADVVIDYEPAKPVFDPT